MNRHLEEALLILKDSHRKLVSDEGGLSTLAEEWESLRDKQSQCRKLLDDAFELHSKEVGPRLRPHLTACS